MKNYTLQPTKNPELDRLVDRDGNWQNYFHKPSGRYLRGITTILQQGYAKGRGFEEWLLRITPAERDEVLRITGDKGDRIHKWIDAALTYDQFKNLETEEKNAEVVSKWSMEEGIYNRETQDYEKPSADEWDAIRSFATFWERHAPVLVSSEFPVYNLDVGYAGTPDAFIILTKACEARTCCCKPVVGKLGLFDWKTGSGIRPSFSAQLGALVHGDNVPALVKGLKVEYGAILRLGTSHKGTGGSEMETFEVFETRKDEDIDKQADRYNNSLNFGFDRFLAAKAIADYEYKPFNPEKDIEEIPDTLTLTVRHTIPVELQTTEMNSLFAATTTTKVKKAKKSPKPKGKKKNGQG